LGEHQSKERVEERKMNTLTRFPRLDTILMIEKFIMENTEKNNYGRTYLKK